MIFGGCAETLKVLPDFKALTNLGIGWVQAADKNWFGTDRGASNDVYEAVVTAYGREAYLNAILEEIESNRVNDGNVIALSGFASDETIFGEDVDHTGTINATVLSVKRRAQATWKGWGVELKLRALSPSFVGTSTFPTLKHCDVGIDGDTDRSINKEDSYSGTFYYADHQSDFGTFTGTFTVTRAEMKSIRRYIATQRTGVYSLGNTFGIDYPFGVNSSGAYPFSCKLIAWDDLGPFGMKWNRLKLKFAEVV